MSWLADISTACRMTVTFYGFLEFSPDVHTLPAPPWTFAPAVMTEPLSLPFKMGPTQRG